MCRAHRDPQFDRIDITQIDARSSSASRSTWSAHSIAGRTDARRSAEGPTSTTAQASPDSHARPDRALGALHVQPASTRQSNGSAKPHPTDKNTHPKRAHGKDAHGKRAYSNHAHGKNSRPNGAHGKRAHGKDQA